MTSQVNIQKIITVVGQNYIGEIVPKLFPEVFDAYKKRDFSRKYFQASIWEHAHASAAILLSVIGIEAHRNRLYYLERSRISRNDVAGDVCKMLTKKNSGFPAGKLEVLLKELFVLRDVVAHNHIYEVTVTSDQNWIMQKHRQKLVKGYGFDPKYKACVNRMTRKTRILKLNAQPAKMSFEDLFKIWIVLDVLAGVTVHVHGDWSVPYRLRYREDNYWFTNVSEFLTHYLDKIVNKRFIKEVEQLSLQLRNDCGAFLPSFEDWFVTNTCPRCSKLGFNKRRGVSSCSKCHFKIETIVLTQN